MAVFEKLAGLSVVDRVDCVDDATSPLVPTNPIQHWINGELVMEYSNPRLLDGTPMIGGHISLQAESHPCQFRNIEIQVLD